MRKKRDFDRSPLVGRIIFNLLKKYFKYITMTLIIGLILVIIVLSLQVKDLKYYNKLHISEKIELVMSIQDAEKENQVLQDKIVQLETEAQITNQSLIDYETKLKKYEAEEKKKIQQSTVKYNNNVNSKTSSKKTFMSYRCITNKNSTQYKLQQQATTDPLTGVRMVNEDYCVAIASYWKCNVGDKVLVTLENGKTFNAIMADAKSNAHTDSQNKLGLDGSSIEFVVDMAALPKEVRLSGNLNVLKQFSGNVISITKR